MYNFENLESVGFQSSNTVKIDYSTGLDKLFMNLDLNPKTVCVVVDKYS